MTTRAYFEAKNVRALTQFQGWLTALSIPFSAGSSGADLLVTKKDGTTVQVQICASDPPPAPAGAVVLQASVITGRNLQAAFDLFGAFVESCGYPNRIPVDRGPVPKQKAHFSDAPELVAFRHTELRRVANPTSAQLAKFAPIIRRACATFMRKYERICQDNMLEFDDLQTYAQIWICNFIGLHQVPETKDGDANLKMATSYLNQRFVEMEKILHKKGRNTFAHLDEAHIAQAGTPFVHGVRTTSARDEGAEQHFLVTKDAFEASEDDSIDQDYVVRHNLMDTSTPATRKSSAEKLLDEALSAMSHDDMIATLQAAVDNNRIDPTARQEAASRLRRHAVKCDACIAVVAEEDEDGDEVSAE